MNAPPYWFFNTRHFRPLPPRYGYALRTPRGYLARIGDDGLQPGQRMFLPSASGTNAIVFRVPDHAVVWLNEGDVLEPVFTMSEYVDATAPDGYYEMPKPVFRWEGLSVIL